MYYYKAFGIKISSEIELPELVKYDSGEDVNIKFGNLNINDEIIVTEGRNFKVTKNGVLLFWDNVGKIKVRDGKHIIVDPISDIDTEFLRLFILGVSLGILLHQRGFLVLHSSSININGKAVAFLGSSGYGKSTTAFSLVLNGHNIISDDIIPLKIDNRSIKIYPGFPALKLSKEILVNIKDFDLRNGNSKYFHSFKGQFSTKPLDLDHIFLLEPNPNDSSNVNTRQNALLSLLINSYCIRLFQKNEKKENLIQCAKVVEKIPITPLKINRSINELPELGKNIEKILSKSREVK